MLGGVDIQKRGSGNIGYANVQRIMGWRYSLPTLLSDVAKGFVPTFIALNFYDTPMAFAIGCAAIVGHIFPIWLKFRGGKGIATGLGVIIAIAPIIALIGVVVYAFIGSFRSSATASLTGVAIVTIGMALYYPQWWWMGVVLLCTALVTLRDNVRGVVPDHG